MEKVCFVDDETDILSMCEDYFSDKYELRVFSSAAEAIKAFDADYSPSVVVTDLKMPVLSGLELAKRAQARQDSPTFIMMSGHANKYDVVDALNENVRGYVEKPFDPRVLKDRIDKALSYSRPSVAAAESPLTHLLSSLCNQLFQLLAMYMRRYVLAENRLFELNIDLHRNREQLKEIMAAGRQQTALEKQIEQTTQSIEAYKKSEAF